MQTLRTGNRFRVSSEPGINGAPSFSPDGRKLVITLGGVDGNPDIYVLDVNSRNATRLTTHRAIDTEGSWSPDGRYQGYNGMTEVPAGYAPPDEPVSQGYGTVATPGVVAGLARLHAEHGALPWSALLQEPARIARDGYELLPGAAARHDDGFENFKDNEGFQRVFIEADGSAEAGSDYEAVSGSLTLAAGETTATITLTIHDTRTTMLGMLVVRTGDPGNQRTG